MSDLPVTQIWNRIDTWLQKNAPDAFAALKPGASEAELEAAQAALGVALPPNVLASYRVHNGSDPGLASVGLAGWYEFFDLDRVQSEWATWKELVDAGEFEDESGQPLQPGIRPDWWNTRWIPLLGDGAGNYLCADLDPAEGGTFGQIIEMLHDDAGRDLVAADFAVLLAQWADDLEAGNFAPTPKGDLVRRKTNG